ncbi:thiamine-phosphate kinase [Glaciimonas sp. CA11.2]|uniref:thiamine-phosphate kinase n=1 Tax=unclassified Glaciimonas TaxID=2644401 RepID=UPI002AB42CF8|nr:MULTISPECIES: thiamine-phosphate kinase [unclassified Glaciimonas]MDY7546806.1 thiamine-phosphate kinase [Glaciimonas sp. CA11.2]MEB0012273.1 thiamine-phosphate kinase [Glaciimonas sp. Cout2]MEB0080539.1 thiamine-phosphate kinase [Glaciimonas sp. Gout2]MEB0163544.1 thiamine-phosphate kinase [Glaciimonas sp. CA11.2]
MLSEFDLISQYFTRAPRADGQIALGVGDDCALLMPTAGMQLAVSSDMLVAGRHFFADVDPYSLGHKSLAVNLSDLAAMGARPLGFTLALALPEARAEWLAPFAAGLLALADAHDCELIGGDTTKGPLNICITIFGETLPGQALRRDAARVGDDVWVSGTLGDARLALAGYRCEFTDQIVMSDDEHARAATRMHQPTPRVALGIALRGIAHAAIDISDGLAGDLGHILERSGVGATLAVDCLPSGPVLRRQTQALQRQFTLAGGDDYELCFTAPAAKRDAVLNAGTATGTEVIRIGCIDDLPGLRFIDSHGLPLDLQLTSFDHFRTT